MRTGASAAPVGPSAGVGLVLVYSLHERSGFATGRVVILAALGVAAAGRAAPAYSPLPRYRVLVAESATAAREARLVTPTDSSLATRPCPPVLAPSRPLA